MRSAFILLDVDNFKQINDIYGHGVGDMILMRMAGILTKVFGDSFLYRQDGRR